MNARACLIKGWLAASVLLCAAVGHAQSYPAKPIRIVTNAAGGGGDFVARMLAQGMAGSLGQPVVIDNRASKLMAAIVAKSVPDGYTLLVSPDSMWVGPLLETMPYDPVRDFAAISLLTRAPNILVVYPSLPAKSVKELIALVRSRPGELNYATGAIGGSNHLAAELFNAMAGVSIVRINYKGSGPGLAALIGGEVQLMFPNAAAGIPHIKSGRLRALGVGSAEVSSLLPGLPTIAASGLPGYESASTVGIFAPAGTSKALVARLNQEVVQFMQRADTRERFFAAGSETAGTTPDQLAATVKSEMTRLGKVIRDAGIRAE